MTEDGLKPSQDIQKYAVVFKSGAVVTVENVTLGVVTYSYPDGYNGHRNTNEWLLLRGERPVTFANLHGYSSLDKNDIAQGFSSTIDTLISLT